MSNNQKSYELLLDIGNDALSLNDLEASETAFLEAVDLKPAPIEAWFGLFQIKQALKHTEQAAEIIDRIIEVAPTNSQFLALRASLELERGKHSAAIKYLEAAVRNDPISESFWIALLTTYSLSMPPNTVLQRLRALSVPNPATLTVVALLAKAELAAGNTSDAETRIRDFLHGAPDDPDRLLLLAKYLTEIGEDTKAQTIYERLLSRDPDNIEIIISSARAEQHDNATIDRAIRRLEQALEIDSNHPEALKILSESYARIAHYADASRTMNRYISVADSPTAEDYFRFGKILQNNQDLEASLKAFDTAKQILTDKIPLLSHDDPKRSSTIAKLARLHVAMGEASEALRLYQTIKSARRTNLIYPPSQYLPDTEHRIESLRRIVRSRDVFILAHGPSIAGISDWCREFSDHDICIAAVNRFKVLENGVLGRSGRAVDIVMNTHYRAIAPHFDQIEEFLCREYDNLFITTRWAMERLGNSLPSRPEIEQRYDKKLFYFGGSGKMEAATPHNPLSFVFGNTLSVLIPLMALGGARRIFLFGADGIKPDWKSPAKHIGEDDPEYRFDFNDRNLDALTSGLRADTIDLDEAVEMGLLSLESLYDFERPPIYNVSPDSAVTAFPKIGFTEAQELLKSAE